MTEPETPAGDTLHTLAVATDEKLAALDIERAGIERKQQYATDTLRRLVGQKRSPRGQWSGTLDEALTAPAPAAAWHAQDHAAALATHIQTQDRLNTIAVEIGALQDVWAANGRWSRFFLVQNNNGHIHSSMSCQTCTPTTRFAWLPSLSGLTEKDAVADQGMILCSVCFATAPTEWTTGQSKTSLEDKERRSLERAERDQKRLDKALLPDGAPLKVRERASDRYDTKIVTLHAAKMFLTDAYDWPGVQDDAINTVAEAVAAKTGVSVDQVLADAKKRAAKRAR